MLIEVLVLDRDGGVAQGRADLLQLYRADARALRIPLLDQLAVAIDEADRSGANVELAGIRQGGQRIREGPQYQDQDQPAGDDRRLQPLVVGVRPPFGQSPSGRLGCRRALSRLERGWTRLSHLPPGWRDARSEERRVGIGVSYGGESRG